MVLGASPTGLYAVRELASAGFRVLLADVARGCANSSRYLNQRGFVGNVDATLDWACAEAKRLAAPAVIVPTSDIFIEAICARNKELGSSFKLFDAYQGIASQLLDKLMFSELCNTHAVPTPRVWQVSDNQQLRALSQEIPFPCILKPVLIHRAKEFLRGHKVLQIAAENEFKDVVDTLPEDVGGWMLQEVIPGPESNLTLVAVSIGSQGQVLQCFSGRKLRQYPAGFGSASLVSSEPCPESQHIAKKFLEGVGFRGICGVEFKRDPRDGQLKIIEINPRPTLWFQIASESGVPVLATACRDLVGLTVPAPASQSRDVLWRYALKDAASAMFYRRRSGSLPFPAPDVSSSKRMRRRSWPVFSLRDPVPALAEPVNFLRKAWARRR